VASSHAAGPALCRSCSLDALQHSADAYSACKPLQALHKELVLAAHVLLEAGVKIQGAAPSNVFVRKQRLRSFLSHMAPSVLTGLGENTPVTNAHCKFATFSTSHTHMSSFLRKSLGLSSLSTHYCYTCCCG
jgi:hypothetical protein